MSTSTMSKVDLVVGNLNYDALLDPAIPAGIRQPDFYENERAYWLSDDGVVSVEASNVDALPEVLVAPRMDIKIGENFMRWTRLHPSHYGVEVDSYFVHHGEVAAHAAQIAWDVLTKALA